MKSITTATTAITENTECTIVKVHTPVIDIKVGVSTQHGLSLRFASFPAFRTFGYHSKQKIMQEVPLLALYLPKVSHQSRNAHATNRHLCGKGERNGVQRRAKVNFSRTMMLALELLQWRKGTSPDEATLNSEEIKPVAIAIIELRLSEGISKKIRLNSF